MVQQGALGAVARLAVALVVVAVVAQSTWIKEEVLQLQGAHKQHVLVTGGAGFIGQHLVKLLLDTGRRVTVLDDFSVGVPLKIESDRLTVIDGDLQDSAARSEALEGVTAIINLAAIASVQKCENNKAMSQSINFVSAANLFEEGRQRGVQAILHASTSAMYGIPEELPLSETSKIAPIGSYGKDKQRAEEYLLGIKDVPVCALRLFNVYGPGQQANSPYSGVLTVFKERVQAKGDLTIFGDGLQTRDFVHVSDVTKAFVAAMESLIAGGTQSPVHGGAFNVCTGQSRTLLDIVDVLEDVTGTTSAVTFAPPRVGDIVHSVGTSEKLWAAIGWEAKKAFAAGMGELLAVESITWDET